MKKCFSGHFLEDTPSGNKIMKISAVKWTKEYYQMK